MAGVNVKRNRTISVIPFKKAQDKEIKKIFSRKKISLRDDTKQGVTDGLRNGKRNSLMENERRVIES